MRFVTMIMLIAATLSIASAVGADSYRGKSIAVVPFVNSSSGDTLDYLETAVPKMIITDLKQSTYLKIVTRDNLESVLAELKFDASDLVDPANASEVGKFLGADLIVTGSILSIGNDLRFDVHVIDVTTAEIVLAEKVTGAGENEIIAMVDEVSMDVISGLTGEKIYINNTAVVKGDIKPLHSSSVLSFWPMLDNKYALTGGSDTAYLELKFVGGEMEVVNNKERLPLNICLVIDRSGSMSGDPIDFAKDAAKYLVDNLGPNDYISIVTFESGVDVVQKPTKVENKAALKSKIDDIYPGDMTNMYDGLQKGYDLAQKKAKKGYVNRVILLSDGHVNEGIQEPEKISGLCSKYKHKKSIVTTCMGIGSDYDEHLLTMLASSGTGYYHHIGQPSQIPTIFAMELTGMINLVAKDVEVELRMGDGVTLANVEGYSYRDMGGNVYKVDVGDIKSLEELSILVTLNLPRVDVEETRPVCSVNLLYNDAVNKKNGLGDRAELVMTFTPEEVLVVENEVEEVTTTVYRIDNAKKMKEVNDLVAEGKRGEAKAVVEEQMKLNMDRASGTNDQDLFDDNTALAGMGAMLEDESIADEEIEKEAQAEYVERAYK